MVAHGTCLVIAGGMLLAASSGDHPLLSQGSAEIGAGVTGILGLLLVALPGTLRAGKAGWSILLVLECLAFATSIVLYFPVLVALGAAVSGAIALLAMRGRADNPYSSPARVDTKPVSIRLAQAAAGLHAVCLLLAAGTLLGLAGAPNPLLHADDALTDAYVNGPLGLLLLLAAAYAPTRRGVGRVVLAATEGLILLASVLLRLPLLILLDVLLVLTTEGLLWYSFLPAGETNTRTQPDRWMRVPLPWVSATILVAFIGFAFGAYLATELQHPDDPLLWMGGVIGAVVLGSGFAWLVLRLPFKPRLWG